MNGTRIRYQIRPQAGGREHGRGMGQHVSFSWKAAPNGENMIPDEEERQDVRLIVDYRDNHRLSFADIADQLKAKRAVVQGSVPPIRSRSGSSLSNMNLDIAASVVLKHVGPEVAAWRFAATACYLSFQRRAKGAGCIVGGVDKLLAA